MGALCTFSLERLYHRLAELNLLNTLDKRLVNELSLAYQRTSITIARKQTQSASGTLASGISLIVPDLKISKESILETSFLTTMRL